MWGCLFLFSVLPHRDVGDRAFTAFWKDERATVGTEYAVLLFVLAMGMAMAALLLSGAISEGMVAAADLLNPSGCDNNGGGTGYGGGNGGGGGNGNTC